MFTRFFTRLSLLLVVVFMTCTVFTPVLVRADGLIVIKHPVMPPPRFTIPVEPMRLNIKYHHVTVSINNQVAITKVDQVFSNPYPYDLEGTYIFPIPEHASIHNFTMHMNNKPVSAKIHSKEEARNIYENIVRQQKDPALLEYIGRGMVQARVYPIPANGEVRITLEYSELLKADNGVVKYYYTLSTEKFSGTPLDDVSIAMDITSAHPLLNVYSPTHKIDINTVNNNGNHNKTHVTYQEKHVRPDRDFIVYYTVSKDEIGFNVLTYKDTQANKDKEDGFFMVLASPNNTSKQSPVVIKKDIVFVIDTSGSMMGEKLEQAKRALLFCLSQLNSGDRFNIIRFDDRVDLYEKNLVSATQANIGNARTYVNNLETRGSTDINSALTVALQQFQKQDTPNMIIFLTDGQPTSGECNIGRIVKNIKHANLSTTRLFVFGVGYDVNTQLLDKLSLGNKGISDYITPNENIESKVSQFYLKISHPVLTDIMLRCRGTQVREIYPVDLPDLFLGSQLLVVGRYGNGGNVTLDLSGKQNATEKHYIYDAKFTENNTENDFLPRIWASRKIAYLVDQMMLHEKQNDEIIKTIVALSKQYGIITEYTSFLVDVDSKEFGKNGVSGDMLAKASQKLTQASCDSTGEASVMRAKGQQCFRESSSVADAMGMQQPGMHDVIRCVRARTFYQKDNIWVDAGHTDTSVVIKIKPMSPAFFMILKTLPDLSSYLAIGNKVMIKAPTCSICIDEAGRDVLTPAELQSLVA